MPNYVKRVAQLHYYRGGSKNQREDAKYSRSRARCGLVSGLNQTLDCSRPFRPDQILDLPYQLTLSRLLAKRKRSDGNNDDEERGQGQQRVKRQGGAEARCVVVDPCVDCLFYECADLAAPEAKKLLDALYNLLNRRRFTG